MSAPPKFETINGVRKISPTWKSWKAAQAGGTPAPSAGSGAAASAEPTADTAPPVATPPIALPMRNEDQALAVMYSVQEVNQNNGQLSEALQTTMNQMEQQNVAASIGISGGHADHMQQLETVFAKYEMPVGMLSKLMQVKDYDYIVCLLDDSGSMGCRSDFRDPATGQTVSRWAEAIIRLKRITEILAYIPTPPLEITGLNVHTVHRISRQQGQSPEQYVAEAHRILEAIEAQGCPGATPMYERMVDMMKMHEGSKRLLWVFGDGTPNGGDASVERIKSLVINRSSPVNNPLTFFQCSENSSDVEWMSEVEEQAWYCSAMDDFQSESREIVLDQGIAFPFSYGLYLCSCIIGAACPDDLDAMDESAPLTKATIDALTGYTTSSEEYHHYFSEFCVAQKRKVPQDAMDRTKKSYAEKFATMEQEFVRARVAREIPLVQEYRDKLANMKSSCCCVVQ